MTLTVPDRTLVACFGEVLLRLSPEAGGTVRDASRFDVHVGGAEANVAVALANLGIPARMITALPEGDLGEHARRTLRAEGIDTSGIAGGEGRMGLYFLNPAIGPLAGRVHYDRAQSVFALAEKYDPSALDGATHLHLSGISLAVSEAASRVTRSVAKAARDRGMTLSFDGNFRPSLWARTGREPRPEIAELVGLANLFIGNHKDIALLLDRDFSGGGSERRRDAALAALDAFPNLDAIASTARHVEDDGTHRITGRIDTARTSAESRERVLSGIVDRIGTGDAFTAGVLAGWLSDPGNLERAVEAGTALSALKHYTPGDFVRVSHEDWVAVMAGGGDVSR
ncbi:sugar kinase [Aurantiacibacter spongiae]|uniref:Sugar kinase n=1 Tax=Aurantiacibacter spongiae TaxID=2488860 RepID=A0A3N5CPM5_9SPHN|nr:sugar kinase [Aurantiacibacter spongiae]RPF70953.1 sugar kinase [Aurantiacibacter spongiae]